MVDHERAKDHYELLGVSRDAADEVVRAAYRALAAKYHPDRNPGNRQAEQTLKRLNAAFEVLGDPAKRKQYDDQVVSPKLAYEPTFRSNLVQDRVERATVGKAGGCGRTLVWGFVFAAFLGCVYAIGRGGLPYSWSRLWGSLANRFHSSVAVTDDPVVLDRTTQQPVHVPPDQAQAGLVSGMYDLDPTGPKVRLVDKKGDRWVVEPNRVASTLASGEFRLVFALSFAGSSRGRGP